MRRAGLHVGQALQQGSLAVSRGRAPGSQIERDCGSSCASCVPSRRPGSRSRSSAARRAAGDPDRSPVQHGGRPVTRSDCRAAGRATRVTGRAAIAAVRVTPLQRRTPRGPGPRALQHGRRTGPRAACFSSGPPAFPPRGPACSTDRAPFRASACFSSARSAVQHGPRALPRFRLLFLRAARRAARTARPSALPPAFPPRGPPCCRDRAPFRTAAGWSPAPPSAPPCRSRRCPAVGVAAPPCAGPPRWGPGPPSARYCGLLCEQKPLMQALVESQQLAAEVHLSPSAEQVLLGGVFEQMSPPSPASQ